MRVNLISWGNNLIQAPPARCLCNALFGILHTEANSFYNYYLWHLMCVSLASSASLIRRAFLFSFRRSNEFPWINPNSICDFVQGVERNTAIS